MGLPSWNIVRGEYLLILDIYFLALRLLLSTFLTKWSFGSSADHSNNLRKDSQNVWFLSIFNLHLAFPLNADLKLAFYCYLTGNYTLDPFPKFGSFMEQIQDDINMDIKFISISIMFCGEIYTRSNFHHQRMVLFPLHRCPHRLLSNHQELAWCNFTSSPCPG